LPRGFATLELDTKAVVPELAAWMLEEANETEELKLFDAVGLVPQPERAKARKATKIASVSLFMCTPCGYAAFLFCLLLSYQNEMLISISFSSCLPGT
jgi:hypothetical protein